MRGLRLGLACGLAVGALASASAGAEDCGGVRRCRCGDRVVESYTLSEDLGPCPANGLRLAARVALDGGGYAIHGAGGKGSVGVSVAASASGSRVHNLEVSGFERGVRLNDASRVEIVGVESHHNGDRGARVGYGIDLAGGASDNLLERVKVHDNADEGIHLGRHARANRITRSEVYDNSRENVYLLAGVDNAIEDSTVRGGGSAAIYIKNSKGSVVRRSRIADRPVTIRGASADTRLVDDRIEGAGVLVQPYLDRELGTVRPARTVLRGGRISAPETCVAVEGATETLLESIDLQCPKPVALSGESVVSAVDTRVRAVDCRGAGELRLLREVEARIVDAERRPLGRARVAVAVDGPGGRPGEAGADGVFRGRVVEAITTCPGGRSRPGPPLHLAAGALSATVAAADFRGEVVLRSPARDER